MGPPTAAGRGPADRGAAAGGGEHGAGECYLVPQYRPQSDAPRAGGGRRGLRVHAVRAVERVQRQLRGRRADQVGGYSV